MTSAGERAGAALRRVPLDLVVLVVGLATTYAVTLQRGPASLGPRLLGVDSAKFALVGSVFGMPHPTGYPLYTVLSRVVAALPLASDATMVNAISALAALAAAVLLRAIQVDLGVRRWLATALAAVFAFTPQWFSQSLVAEVYTLHVALVLAVLWAAVRFVTTGQQRWALVGWAAWCTGLGHHATIVLLVPVMAVALWHGRRALDRRALLVVPGLVALAACQYLVLVWRTRAEAPVLENRASSIGDIWFIVSGGSFRGRMFAFSPGELLTDRVELVWTVLWGDVAVLLLAAALGLVCLWRSGIAGARTVLVMACGALAIPVAHAMTYDIPDISTYFLSVEAVLVLLAGVGLERLASLVRGPLAARMAVPAVVGVGALLLATSTITRDDLRTEPEGAALTRRQIATASSDAVLLSGDYVRASLANYYLIGEGEAARRRVWLLWEPTHAVLAQKVDRYLRAGQPLGLELGAARVPHPTRPLDPNVDAPPGRGVYVIDPNAIPALLAAGLAVTEHPEVRGLWRVAAPA